MSGIEWECSPEFEADVETAISFLTQVGGVLLELGFFIKLMFLSTRTLSSLFPTGSREEVGLSSVGLETHFFSIVDDF